MTTVKLDDEIFNELHILTNTEYNSIGSDFKSKARFDSKIKCAFLPGYGTTLFYENKHFIIVNEKQALKHYAVWRNHKIIGYADITKAAADKANKASNAEFYFAPDTTTNK